MAAVPRGVQDVCVCERVPFLHLFLTSPRQYLELPRPLLWQADWLFAVWHI